MNLDASLLEILVCPACRAEVRSDEAAQELVCQGCGLAYPVRDDIPVMLVDEARKPAPPTRREPNRREPTRSEPTRSEPAASSTPAEQGPGRTSTEQAAAEGPGDTAPPAARD